MEGTIREKLEAEQIIKEEPTQWVYSETVMQSGKLVLTRIRLLFMLNGAQNAAISIDLDTINGISHKSILTDHNIMCVSYLQYDEVKFSVLNYDEWEKAIEGARMEPHI